MRTVFVTHEPKDSSTPGPSAPERRFEPPSAGRSSRRPERHPLAFAGAAVGTAVVWGPSTWFAGRTPLVPFLLAVVALVVVAPVAGLRSVASRARALQGADVGLMAGAFGAYDAGLFRLAHAVAGPAAAGPMAAGLWAAWLAAAHLAGFGVWFGWMGRAVGGPPPFGDPREIPDRVADRLRRNAPRLAAALALTVGFANARTAFGIVTFGTAAAAYVVALGLRAGNAAAVRVRRSRLGGPAAGA